MRMMVGDNRFESIGARSNDAKVQQGRNLEQQAATVEMEKNTKKAASDGVVLELSKTGLGTAIVEKEEKVSSEMTKKEEKEQQKEAVSEQNAIQQEQTQMLENIDIT